MLATRVTARMPWAMSGSSADIPCSGRITTGSEAQKPTNVGPVSPRDRSISGIAINADGRVVWADDRRQGIQFTKVSAENHRAIRDFDFIVAVEK